MRFTQAVLFREFAALHMITTAVRAVSATVLCGQYENITDPTSTYSRKSSDYLTSRLTLLYGHALVD
jgi:hypothetical protein